MFDGDLIKSLILPIDKSTEYLFMRNNIVVVYFQIELTFNLLIGTV